MDKKHIYLHFYPHPDPLAVLRIMCRNVTFAVQNVTDMCAISTTFSRFERLMESEQVLRNPSTSFNSICRRLHVAPSSLNEYIEEELGLSGEELVGRMREAGTGSES